MGGTPTGPSPGWLLDAPTAETAEPASERERALAEENARLRRTCAALIERVESSGVAGGAPYAAFEHAVLLAEQVRERTEALHRTLDELGQVNDQLRDEIATRVAAEARLREAKREAEAANLSKTRFLAAVSHDLLQPLNAARLFTSALDEHEVPAASKPLVGQIGRSLKDVEALLGTLVDISRLDAGVLKPDIAAFGADELLDTLAEEYQQVAHAQGLTLHYVRSTAVVDSDLQLLARVVRNFLTNAIRYTATGHVLLGCRRRHDGLEIVVGDTGPGIADDQRETIFLEFRRAAAGLDREQRGLGLGLAIVDRIAAMLGHPITLRSRPGQGSAFSVRVPYACRAPRPATPAEVMPGNDQLAGAKVWIVDDDPAVLEGMRALLTGWGCRIAGGLSLAALREAAAELPRPDLLVVDYHLDAADDDGLAVAEQLQRERPGLPVLMVTANHDAALKARIRERGYAYLLKPVKPLRLKMLLVSLLGLAA